MDTAFYVIAVIGAAIFGALRLVADLFEKGGWPMSAFFMVLVLRKGINKFLKRARIKSVELGPLKVEIEDGIVSLEPLSPTTVSVQTLI